MPSITPVESSIDTFISQQFTGTNYGTSTTFYHSGNGLSRALNALLNFDFSAAGIPVGSTIDTGTMSIYQMVQSVAESHDVNVYRLRRTDWNETGATWTNYKAGNAWSTGGAMNTATDHDTTSAASFTAPNSNAAWVDCTCTALVADAYASRSSILHVLIHYTTSSTQTYKENWSSEYAVDTTLRPKLAIVYTPPVAAIVEPRIAGKPARIRGRAA